MNGIAGDARYALRNLRRTPAFAAVSLITLSLGLGVAAAAFTVVDRILIEPLSFPASDRLVMLHASVPPEGSDTVEVTYLDMNDVARETTVFKSVALVMPYAGTATALDPPERIEGLDISIARVRDVRHSARTGTGFYRERRRARSGQRRDSRTRILAAPGRTTRCHRSDARPGRRAEDDRRRDAGQFSRRGA